LARPGVASLAEITKATAWQHHSIRGFMANAGLRGAKNGAGERVYRAAQYSTDKCEVA
jgi:hypothetical protein